ncbi:hypothetical protein FJZ31_11005 [Candidatus Poribacteria bacterium]|nr:hypothetical protein [Candidatus Poribacteria bacterium]
MKSITFILNILLLFFFSGLLSPKVQAKIDYVYIVSISHLDIGFTDIPSVVADQQLDYINDAVVATISLPGYKFTVEAVWQLENWFTRANAAEKNIFIDAMQKGNAGVTGGFASMHTSTLGDEQLNRLLYSTKRIAQELGVTIDTLIQDDVDGYTWAYPQMMAKNGVKYFLTGVNDFLGRANSLPLSDMPFYWTGPDGSKVLTWVNFRSYAELFLMNPSQIEQYIDAKIKGYEAAGYPYDAILILNGFDNSPYYTYTHDAVVAHNKSGSPVTWIEAQPSEFFQHLEQNAIDQGLTFPNYSGDWASIVFDHNSTMTPVGMAKNRKAHHLIQAAEQLATFDTIISGASYPESVISNVYHNMNQWDEHSGGGPGWPEYWTPEQTYENDLEHHAFATDALNDSQALLDSGLNAIVSYIPLSSPAIIVYNSLSWERNDVVRVLYTDTQFDGPLSIIDISTGFEVPYQRPAAGEILFIAYNVPSIGYKLYEVKPGQQPQSFGGGVKVTANTLENQFYRITLDSYTGLVTGIYEKNSGRELVKQNSDINFNGLVYNHNLDALSGIYYYLPPANANITVGLDGEAAKSLVVQRTDDAQYQTELILYDNINRIDFVNNLDTKLLPYVKLEDAFDFHCYYFPFDIAEATLHYEIPNGTVVPVTNHLPGAETSVFVTGGLSMDDGAYCIDWRAREAFVHEFDKINFLSKPSVPSVSGILLSRILKKSDEVQYSTGVGLYDGPPEGRYLTFHYTLSACPGTYDSIRLRRLGLADNQPLQARIISATPHLDEKETKLYSESGLPNYNLSFFKLNVDNCMIKAVKKAEWGEGFILRLQEYAGFNSDVEISSNLVKITEASLCNLLEEDISLLPVKNSVVYISLGPYEIQTVRLSLKMPFVLKGAINGHVTDQMGNPIAGARILVIKEENSKITAKTDSYGCYEIPELLPGVYRVVCIKMNYKNGIAQVKVYPGEITTQNFELEIN